MLEDTLGFYEDFIYIVIGVTVCFVSGVLAAWIASSSMERVSEKVESHYGKKLSEKGEGVINKVLQKNFIFAIVGTFLSTIILDIVFSPTRTSVLYFFFGLSAVFIIYALSVWLLSSFSIRKLKMRDRANELFSN